MDSRISSYFFFILLLGAVIAVALIFLPFLTPLILSLAGAVVVYPVYRWLLRIFGLGSLGRTTSALITVTLVLVVILVPLFLLIGSIYVEIQDLYGMLIDEANRSQVIDALNSGSQLFSDMVFGILPAHSFDSLNITTYLKDILEWAFSNIDTIFSSLAKIAGYALVFLIALFYFLRDGAKLKRLFISWSPLLDSNDEYITLTFKKAIRSVFAGTIAVSILEGLSVGLAFMAFGIPAPALWGTIAAVASLVPGLGTSILILPGAAYLVLSGNYLFAIGLLVWGYAGTFIIDHLIGPAMINKGVNIHPFLILLSVLGGILMFGIVGFIVGPIVLVCLFTLLEIYKNSFVDNGNIVNTDDKDEIGK
jgi:predicted PurR-regulated permease PerM